MKQPPKKQPAADLPPKDNQRPKGVVPTYGAFAMQPVTKADKRYPETNVACPDDTGVEENRDWVMFNEK